MSVIIEALETLEAYLKQKFPQHNTKRTYSTEFVEFPKMDPSDPVEILLTPFDRTSSVLDRSGGLSSTVGVDVTICKKLETVNNETVDPLIDVMSDVFELLLKAQVLSDGKHKYRIEMVEYEDGSIPIYDPDALAAMNFKGRFQVSMTRSDAGP